MDKNGARGRAEKTISSFLEALLSIDGMVDEILLKSYGDKDVAAAIKEQIQDIANEHAQQAGFHRAVERGEPITNREDVNPAGDVVKLYIGNEAEETEGQCSVRLDALGYNIGFDVFTPIDALNLYNALLKVKEVEAH